MKIEKKLISELIPADYNSRKSTKEQEANLKDSLAKFGVVEPIIVNERKGRENIIIGGHFRLRELKKMGKKNVHCVLLDLSEEDEKELNIRLNANTGDWDYAKLEEWDREELADWGLELKDGGLGDDYTQNVGEIIYEPGESNHEIGDLYRREDKFDDDIKKIKNKEMREMLKVRANNFSRFEYPKIADYYAYQATPEEQRIFERLSLVLLDRDQLIEHGFSKLIFQIDDDAETYENGESV